jgi:aspartate 1-decarboxylase
MLRIISIIIILSFTSCEKTFVEPIKAEVVSKEKKKPVKKTKKKKKSFLKKFFNKKVVSCHK